VKIRAVLRQLMTVPSRALRRREQQWAARGVAPRAALRAAHSVESDEDARRRLKDEIASNGQGVREALAIFSKMREQYDTDRAYRLLYAVLTDTPVEPVAADHRDLFSREEQLGRMPLTEAFSFLAKHQPMLLEAAAPVSLLLGPAAQDCTDRLLESQLALSIASQHLAILDGSHDGDDSCSYFLSPNKRMTLSSVFDRR
jgi:hypothetical protein